MRRGTKKARVLDLYAAGGSVEAIAHQLDTQPSYVANVLAAAGDTPAYHDLYVSSTVQSGYAQPCRGLLRFKDVKAAQDSVRRLDTLYHACEQHGDRRGQHQAQVLALIGKNRAEGLGKYAEAQVFAEWLVQHLTVRRPVLEPVSPCAAAWDDISPDAGGARVLPSKPPDACAARSPSRFLVRCSFRMAHARKTLRWVKRCPMSHAEIAIRQVFEAEDFGPAFTPALREQEERLRAQVAAKR